MHEQNSRFVFRAAACIELDGAARDPEADNQKQHADPRITGLTSRRHEPCAQRQITGGAQRQNYGEDGFEVHRDGMRFDWYLV